MGKKILAFPLLLILTGCFGPSEEQILRANQACEKFVFEELARRYRDELHIFSTYSNKGKMVVELGYRNKSTVSANGGYTSRVCVFDENTGIVSLPSVLNMNDWKK